MRRIIAIITEIFTGAPGATGTATIDSDRIPAIDGPSDIRTDIRLSMLMMPW